MSEISGYSTTLSLEWIIGTDGKNHQRYSLEYCLACAAKLFFASMHDDGPVSIVDVDAICLEGGFCRAGRVRFAQKIVSRRCSSQPCRALLALDRPTL